MKTVQHNRQFKTDSLKAITALKNGITELPPFLTRHLCVATKALIIPMQLAKTPDQLALYSAVKTPNEYAIAFGDESLSSIFLCINANPKTAPWRVGIYFRKGLLYTFLTSGVVGMMTFALPYGLQLLKVPEDITQEAFHSNSLMIFNNISAVSFTYLIHFMNALDINRFNIFIQVLNCGLLIATNQLMIETMNEFKTYQVASLTTNLISCFAILMYLGLSAKTREYELYKFFQTEHGVPHLTDMIQSGLPRGIGSLVSKAGSLGVSAVLSQDKQPLKALTTPEQYKKIFETLSKSFHKSYIKLTGIEYGKEHINSTIKYARTGQALLPSCLIIALVSYALFGHTFIASNTDVSDSSSSQLISIAFGLLIIRGVLDIVQFCHEGSEIWFAASKNTMPAMLTAIIASVLTLTAAISLKASHANEETLYASQLIGAVPAALLLLGWGVYDQRRTLRQGQIKLTTILYPSTQTLCTEDNIVLSEEITPMSFSDDSYNYGSFYNMA